MQPTGSIVKFKWALKALCALMICAGSELSAAQIPWKTLASSSQNSRAGGVGMVLSAGKKGVQVHRVIAGGPAARAGVRAADVIVTINGRPCPTRFTVAADRIRGPIGSSVKLGLQRKGQLRSALIKRIELAALLPPLSEQPIVVKRGLRLVHIGASWMVGVAFEGVHSGLRRYRWIVAPAKARFGGKGTIRGIGVISETGPSTIQVANVELRLARWPQRAVSVVTRSSGPIAVVHSKKWRDVDPLTLKPVKPRRPNKPYRPQWGTGPCSLRLHFHASKALPKGARVSLSLRTKAGVTKYTPTKRLSPQGQVEFSLPNRLWQLVGLSRSLPGLGRDLFYSHTLKSPMDFQCGDQVHKVALLAKPPMNHTDSPPASLWKHPLVGKPMPIIGVRKWLSGRTPGIKSLKNRAVLIYLWASWCGPCKAVTPLMAELAARRGGQGLRVVAMSVDRNRYALIDAVSSWKKGAFPIGWVGSSALSSVALRGVPTALLIDDRGIVQALHMGGGMALSRWLQVIDEVLAQAHGKVPRRNIATWWSRQSKVRRNPSTMKQVRDKKVRKRLRDLKLSAKRPGVSRKKGKSPTRRSTSSRATKASKTRDRNTPSAKKKTTPKRLKANKTKGSKIKLQGKARKGSAIKS